MEVLRFGLAFGGVLLALISSLTSIDASLYSFMMFAALVVFSLRNLNRMALSFAGICAMATVFVFWFDEAKIDLRASAFIFAFLLVSGSLRVAASSEPTVQGLGQTLANTPQRHQFTAISLGTGLLALVLLNGALQFVTGIFSSKSNAPLSQRLPIMRAIIAGFALNPILSPIAIPFVVTSSMLPAMSWAPLAPFLFACAIVVWVSGAFQARATNDRNGDVIDETASSESASFQRLVVATLLVLAPIAATILLIFTLGLRPGQAAFTSIFLSSLIWPVFRLRQPRLIYSGYTVAINEATVVGGSIFLGLLLVSYLPSGFSETAAQFLLTSGAAAPVAIFAFFVIGGLLGLQPSICFLLIYAVVLSYANTVGAAAVPVMASMIVGWAINSIVSPFGVPVMIVSGAFRVRSYEFAYRHGFQFLVFSVVGCSAVLFLGAMLL